MEGLEQERNIKSLWFLYFVENRHKRETNLFVSFSSVGFYWEEIKTVSALPLSKKKKIAVWHNEQISLSINDCKAI